MDLATTPYPDIMIITVNAGRIDAAAAIAFKDAMRAAVANGPARVVLDLSHVTFVDSSGLGAIARREEGLLVGYGRLRSL